MSTVITEVVARLSADARRFTAGMAAAAAEAEAFQHAVEDANRQLGGMDAASEHTGASVRGLGKDVDRTSRSTREYTLEMAIAEEQASRLRNELRQQARAHLDAGRAAEEQAQDVRVVGKEIDKLSGRLRIFADLAATIGPALVPITAAAIPAVAGLTGEIVAAGAAVGVTALAVSGLGDALKAVDEVKLAPTRDNIKKMREEMERLDPAGQRFVRFLSKAEDQLRSTQAIARQGVLPGFQDGMKEAMSRLPQVKRLVSDIGMEVGSLARRTGAAFASDKVTPFFRYLRTDAVPTLRAVAESAGNVAYGIANIVVGMAPMSRDFTSGMESMTRSFANWSETLDTNQGFQDFVDYARASGPEVIDLIGSIVDAATGIVQATAPLGRVVVPVLTEFFQVIADIAGSDFGKPIMVGVAAMALLGRATQAWQKISTGAIGSYVRGQGQAVAATLRVVSAQERATTSAAALAAQQRSSRAAFMAAGAQAAAFGLVASGVAGDMGLANTAALGLAGSFMGPWGAAAGVAVGLTMDLREASTSAGDAIGVLDAALKSATTTYEQYTQAIDQGKRATEALEEKQSKLGDALTLIPVVGGYARAGLEKYFGGTKKKLQEATKAAEDQRDAMQSSAAASARYGVAIKMVGGQAQLATTQIRSLVEAMEEQRDQALRNASAQINYQRTLDEATKAAKDAKQTLDTSTEAGRKNKEQLIALAAAWNSQGKAITNNKAAYASARKTFIDLALQMGATKDQAKRLADQWMEIPESKVIQLRLLGDTEASSSLGRIITQMARIKDKTVRLTYYVNQVNANNKGPIRPGGSQGETPRRTPRETVPDGVGRIAAGAVSSLRRQAGEFEQYGQWVGLAIIRGLESKGASVSKAAHHLAQQAKDAADRALAIINRTGSSSGPDFSAQWKDIAQDTRRATEKLRQEYERGLAHLKKPTAKAIAELKAKLAAGLRDVGKEFEDRISEWAKAVRDRKAAIADQFQSLIDKVQGKIDDLKSEWADKLDDMRSKAQDARDAIVDAYDTAVEQVKDQFADLRDAAQDRLDDTIDKFNEVKSAAQDFGKSVRDAFKLAFSMNTGSVLGDMRASIQQNLDFIRQLEKLRSAGLNETSLKNILDAGAVDGSKLAQNIMDENSIREINALQAAFDDAVGAFSDAWTDDMYGDQITQAQAAMTAAQDALNAINDAETKLLADMKTRHEAALAQFDADTKAAENALAALYEGQIAVLQQTLDKLKKLGQKAGLIREAAEFSADTFAAAVVKAGNHLLAKAKEIAALIASLQAQANEKRSDARVAATSPSAAARTASASTPTQVVIAEGAFQLDISGVDPDSVGDLVTTKLDEAVDKIVLEVNRR